MEASQVFYGKNTFEINAHMGLKRFSTIPKTVHRDLSFLKMIENLQLMVEMIVRPVELKCRCTYRSPRFRIRITLSNNELRGELDTMSQEMICPREHWDDEWLEMCLDGLDALEDMLRESNKGLVVTGWFEEHHTRYLGGRYGHKQVEKQY